MKNLIVLGIMMFVVGAQGEKVLCDMTIKEAAPRIQSESIRMLVDDEIAERACYLSDTPDDVSERRINVLLIIEMELQSRYANFIINGLNENGVPALVKFDAKVKR